MEFIRNFVTNKTDMKMSIKLENIMMLTLVFFFSSCNFILKEDNSNSINTAAVQQNKLEANLLLKATRKNLKTIALCTAIENNSKDAEVIEAVRIIKNEQKEILESLQKIAKENMISVPNLVRKASYTTNLNTDKNKLANKFIAQVQNNLDVQKEVLDSLIKGSNNQKILLVAEENIEKLKSNIKITSNALESLK